ncbi:MAG: TlpA disulfide reductase family protein [Pseudomonadota bacterium]
MKRWVLIAAAVFAANAAFFQWRTGDGPDGAGLSDLRAAPIGFKAPDAPLQTDDGRILGLSDWRGQVAVVALWATWCPICRHEMPQLDKLASGWAEHGIAILPISLDRHPRSLDLIQDWYRRHEIITLPVLHDKDGRFAGTVTATATPTTLIIDRSGAVVASVVGRTDWADPAIGDYLIALVQAKDTEAARALLSR